MPKYKVKVVRTERASHEFVIEQAADEDDARQQALEQARDFDFADGLSEEYKFEVSDSRDFIEEMA